MNASPICRHLRTKSMFIPALAQTANPADPNPAAQPSHSAHPWCNCTLTETGPDDRPVSAFACSPSRPCFEE